MSIVSDIGKEKANQMAATTRIFTAVLFAVVVFGAWSWWTTRNVDPFDINSQSYMPAGVAAPPIEAPLTRVVAPGGPNAPNQAPPSMRQTLAPPETAYDPQDQPYESAEHPERLRHPERMFGPGIENDGTSDAVAAGTASTAVVKTEQSFQEFGPEFAQNGGVFLDTGVIANDTTVDLSYSSI